MIIELITEKELTIHLQTQLTELYKQLNADLTQLNLTTILSNHNKTDVVICMDGGVLAGIAMMAKYKVISGHKGMIEDVVVSTDYRGKGIGRKLMEKLLEQAEKEKLNDVLLFSAHHRTVAITLYKSLGFKLKNSGLYVKNYLK